MINSAGLLKIHLLQIALQIIAFLHLPHREGIKLIEELFVIDSSGSIPIQTAVQLFNNQAVQRKISSLHETTFGTLIKGVFSGQVARKLRKLSKNGPTRACKYLCL